MMATSGSQYADCRLVKDRTLKLETEAIRKPVYNGVLVTEDILLVIDNNSCDLQLYSHDGKLLSTYHRLKSSPLGVCLISKTEVAVCLFDSTIVILSFKYIDEIKHIKTLNVTTGFNDCHSVAKLHSSDKLVLSGFNHDCGMLCWCVVNLTDGRVESIQMICNGGINSHSKLAIKYNTVYISTDVSTDDGVYAYNIFIPHPIKFLYKHPEWTPGSIIVDGREFIYVCDRYSNSIHQLTDSGQLVTIHTVSSRPREIFYYGQHGVLYTTSKDSNEITVYRLEYLHQPGIPEEILNMDERSIQLFEEALKDGKETVHSIRIMVVGHMGVGKTTLVKRLLGEEVNISKRRSTEGIDVYVNCCDVSLSTFEWTRRMKDPGQDYQLQRLARVLNEQQSMKNKVSDEEEARNLSQGEVTVKRHDLTSVVFDDGDMEILYNRFTKQDLSSPKALTQAESIQSVIIPPQVEITLKSHERDHTTVQAKDTDDLYSHSPEQDCDHNLLCTTSPQGASLSASVQMKSTVPDTSTMAMLKLLQENAFNIKQDTGKTSPLSVWDFAGQFSFYTTHQTFLTRRAIYLLVSDVSEQLTDLVDDECYFDREGMMKCKVLELIEVWLNCIHSCAPFPGSNIPPVILVGTHVDKILQKKSPRKGTESDGQTTLLKTGEFTQLTTSKHTATTKKEEPRALNVLESIQNCLKPRKSEEMDNATLDSSTSGIQAISAVDLPKTEKPRKFWETIQEKKRMRANAKKKYRHEICERYFKAIRTCLSDKPTRFHLVNEDFAIDNTVVDSRLEDLKRKIVKVASQQSYWWEQIPARWIPLEQELIRLRAAGVKVISLVFLKDLNQAGSIPVSSDELNLFLRFQHDIGTILYFSMDILKDNIVLDPQWMIDALKSLITAEMFVLRSNPAVTDKWFEFKKKGKLSQELIDAVWTKKKHPDLYDNKDHILLLMEQLNIIAKLKVYSEEALGIKEENCFLAPCMLQQKTPKEVICPEAHPQMESSSVICYVFVGKYLPFPIFHRLLAACVANWPIATKKNENTLENQIFCGCGVFQLDQSHKLTIHFRDYIIFMRVTRMSIMDKIPYSKLCIKAREFVSATLIKIIGCLGQSLKFEYFIQCPEYKGDSIYSLIPVSLLKETAEVYCELHNNMVESCKLLQFWFENIGSDGEKGGNTANPDIQDQILPQAHDVRVRTMSIPSKLYQSKGVPCSDPKLLCQILSKSQQVTSTSQSSLEENCLSVGLELHGVTPADGNCFFEAVFSQLQRLNCVLQTSPQQLRQEVVAFIRTNRVLHAHEGTINLDSFIYDETFEDYCTRMARDGEWADHVVVVAMARKLQMDMMIVMSSPSAGPEDFIVWVVGQTDFHGETILLGHIWESHYLSLKPITPANRVPVVVGSSVQATTDVPKSAQILVTTTDAALGSISSLSVGPIITRASIIQQVSTYCHKPSPTLGSTPSTIDDLMQAPTSSSRPSTSTCSTPSPKSGSTTVEVMQTAASEVMQTAASISSNTPVMQCPMSATTTTVVTSAATSSSTQNKTDGFMQVPTPACAPSQISSCTTTDVIGTEIPSSTIYPAMQKTKSISKTADSMQALTCTSTPQPTTGSAPFQTVISNTVDGMHTATSSSTANDVMQNSASDSNPSTSAYPMPEPVSSSVPDGLIQAQRSNSTPPTTAFPLPVPTFSSPTGVIMQAPISVSIPSTTAGPVQTPTSSSTSADVTQPSTVDDTDRFMHIACLLVDVGSRVLRRLLIHHTVTPTCTLDQYLAKNRIAIDSLRKRKILNTSQMDILFPPGGSTNLGDYDITLLSALFTNIVPTISQQQLNMIQFLRDKRNEIFAHAKSVAVNSNDYQTFWNDICRTLEALSKQCNDPDFENEILREIQGIQVSTLQGNSFLDTLQTHHRRIETIERLVQALLSSQIQESSKTSDDSDS